MEDKWLRAEQEINYRIRAEFRKHVHLHCLNCEWGDVVDFNDEWFVYATKKIIRSLKEILK